MNGIHRSLALLRDGQEIHAPRTLLALTPEQACRRLPGVPYSVAQNVAHTVNWQRLWLHQLGADEPLSDNYEEWNWPDVAPSQWPALCQQLLEGLDRAIDLAANGANDQTEFVLNQILIHNAYHIGECILLTRLLEPDQPA